MNFIRPSSDENPIFTRHHVHSIFLTILHHGLDGYFPPDVCFRSLKTRHGDVKEVRSRNERESIKRIKMISFSSPRGLNTPLCSTERCQLWSGRRNKELEAASKLCTTDGAAVWAGEPWVALLTRRDMEATIIAPMFWWFPAVFYCSLFWMSFRWNKLVGLGCNYVLSYYIVIKVQKQSMPQVLLSN